MHYQENNRQGYWKRYFDDERRNKITQYPKTINRPQPLLRKSKSPEQREINALKSDLKSYKNLINEEKKTNEHLICQLLSEKNKAQLYKRQLENIKKCLMKANLIVN
tara:strand:+ start:2806 stop:3126 length:321 start_codon:yes stop_codon:yes gene_type:complete